MKTWEKQVIGLNITRTRNPRPAWDPGPGSKCTFSVQWWYEHDFSHPDFTWCWFQSTTKLPFSTCYFPPFIIFSSDGYPKSRFRVPTVHSNIAFLYVLPNIFWWFFKVECIKCPIKLWKIIKYDQNSAYPKIGYRVLSIPLLIFRQL